MENEELVFIRYWRLRDTLRKPEKEFQPVGWVELFAKPITHANAAMGFASASLVELLPMEAL